MDKLITFLKKSFKYIALSALGLFVLLGLIAFFSYQYDEYMSRPDERVGFKCDPESEIEQSFYMVIESSKESRSERGYYDGVKILGVDKAPNSNKDYLVWNDDYSAARTEYEIFIVKGLYQRLLVIRNPNDEEIKPYMTIDRTTLKAKRFTTQLRIPSNWQCRIITDEELKKIDKAVPLSKADTLKDRQI